MVNVIRVFPRKTSYTPTDEYAFVGEPPMMRPEAERVDVSCVFTWDLPEARRLVEAWSQYYPSVVLGGPAVAPCGEAFQPGMYVKQGVTFTSRGCDNNCPWCLVPEREGKLRVIVPRAGYIIQDNNFLQTPSVHRQFVYRMLSRQPRAAVFSGGLQASLVTDEIAEELRGIRIAEVFLAADTEAALRPLEKAIRRLSFLPRRKLRVYTLLVAYNGETIQQATTRLERVWELGGLPFAQLFRPPDKLIEYSDEWKQLARTWSRPAAMFSLHKVGVN